MKLNDEILSFVSIDIRVQCFVLFVYMRGSYVSVRESVRPLQLNYVFFGCI